MLHVYAFDWVPFFSMVGVEVVVGISYGNHHFQFNSTFKSAMWNFLQHFSIRCLSTGNHWWRHLKLCQLLEINSSCLKICRTFFFVKRHLNYSDQTKKMMRKKHTHTHSIESNKVILHDVAWVCHFIAFSFNRAEAYDMLLLLQIVSSRTLRGDSNKVTKFFVSWSCTTRLRRSSVYTPSFDPANWTKNSKWKIQKYAKEKHTLRQNTKHMDTKIESHRIGAVFMCSH